MDSMTPTPAQLRQSSIDEFLWKVSSRFIQPKGIKCQNDFGFFHRSHDSLFTQGLK